MKFCKDCKHIITRNDNLPMYWYCAKTADYNLVSGEADYRFAEFERMDDDGCGKQGTFFEPAVDEVAT